MKSEKTLILKKRRGEISGSPGLHASTAGGQDSTPGWGIKLSQAPLCSQKKKREREFMGKKKTYMEKRKDVDKPPSPRGLWPQLSGQAHLQWGTRSPGWRRPGQGGRGAGKLAARGGEGAVPLTPSVQQHAGPLSPERPLVSPLARCRTGEAASQRHSPRTGVLQTQG